jgi:phage gp45-like
VTTQITVSAPAEHSVRVCESDGVTERWSYIAAGETRIFHIWGDRTILVKEGGLPDEENKKEE